ncbi:hypothetical protein [Allosphingosinicella sp.]|jgi:hypothetical protein|uniref:hypothetical protein n=1 Tax=Allosphingosinicella sp. TaxID=2823234 RepID=UPI002F1181E9
MRPGESSKFWRLAFGATLLVAAAVLLAMFMTDYRGTADNFRIEAAKLLLQFVMVGVGGTLILAYVNDRRDSAARRQIEAAEAEKTAADARTKAQGRAAIRRGALQELIGRVGDAHRRLKVVKRQMRSAIPRAEPDPDGPPERPYRVPAEAFVQAMDDLLHAQIASEEVGDRIDVSVELLEPYQIERMKKALRYGARYFHDVYEDYEHGRVKRVGDEFEITCNCNNLHNFLFGREPPRNLSPEHQERLIAGFRQMHDQNRSLEQRYKALEEIEELRQADRPHGDGRPRRRRYRSIATECYALAGDELRQALWLSCSKDLEPDAGSVASAGLEAGAAAAR